VTCTGGEAGDILNPAMDRPDVKDNIAEVRRAELDAAAQVIGYDEVVMLGYRDSGMPDSEANADPRCFAQAPLDEAVGRLVAIIRRERPQVVVTYPKDQKGYPHPDHLRVNEISEIAFDAAADPGAFPEAGEPWQAARLLYTTWSVKRVYAMHDKFLELGLESPYTDERFKRMLEARETVTEGPGAELPRIVVDVTGHAQATRLGLLAHATQVDPNSRHWFGLPEDVADAVYPYEEYEVARDLTGSDDYSGDIFRGTNAAVAG
jgi:mycothiol S-conjugate amidase